MTTSKWPLRVAKIGAWLLALLIFTQIAAKSTEAGHVTATYYHCPDQCLLAYVQGQYLYVHLEDWFSDSEITWKPAAAEPARNAWWNAPGPQLPTFTYVSGAHWVYMIDEEANGANGLGNAVAVTHRCYTDSFWGAICTYDSTSVRRWEYGVQYFSPSKMNVYNDPQQQFIFAHEFGHALLLAHHGSGGACSGVLMQGNVICSSPGGPSSTDIGNVSCPTSGSYGNRGIKCIFNWN